MSGLLKSPWDRVSVAGLAGGAASTHGARLFIQDCPDRFSWNGEEPRALSFDEFNRRALFFGAQMLTLGLNPGQRILLMLPNSVELAIAVIGARAAGLVPAIAPLEESQDALRAAAERAGVLAIVTSTRCEDLRLSERARQIAGRAMSVRYVAGFGFGLPDGIMPLDGWSEDEARPLANAVPVKQGSEALITFARIEGVLTALIRSEAQLVSDALAFAARARLNREAGVIAALQPGSVAALVTGVLAPLFLGMPSQLLGPFREYRLADAVRGKSGAALVVTASFAETFRAARASHLELQAIGSLVILRRPQDEIRPVTTLPDPTLSEVSLLDLDECALLPLGAWPATGIAHLDGEHPHPMDDILPEGVCLVALRPNENGLTIAGGFGEARIIQRDTRLSSPDAA
jgi:AMP-binding enzyme